MGADLTNRRSAGLDERVEVMSYRALVILFAQFFLCPYDINDPIRERFPFDHLEQRREFKMGMEVDQAGKKDGFVQTDHAMTGKPFFDLVFSVCRGTSPGSRYREVVDLLLQIPFLVQ